MLRDPDSSIKILFSLKRIEFKSVSRKIDRNHLGRIRILIEKKRNIKSQRQ